MFETNKVHAIFRLCCYNRLQCTKHQYCANSFHTFVQSRGGTSLKVTNYLLASRLYKFHAQLNGHEIYTAHKC